MWVNFYTSTINKIQLWHSLCSSWQIIWSPSPSNKRGRSCGWFLLSQNYHKSGCIALHWQIICSPSPSNERGRSCGWFLLSQNHHKSGCIALHHGRSAKCLTLYSFLFLWIFILNRLKKQHYISSNCKIQNQLPTGSMLSMELQKLHHTQLREHC